MSIYDPLIEFLKNSPPDCDEIKLSLSQIKIILRRNLPESARIYDAWWHGRDRPHVQRWETIGWKAKTRHEKGQITSIIFKKVK